MGWSIGAALGAKTAAPDKLVASVIGEEAFGHTPPAMVSTEQLLKLVRNLNTDYEVDGILVQLPLPAQVDAKNILEAVDPLKDVDGFHPVNLGKLVSNRPGLVACTPAG